MIVNELTHPVLEINPLFIGGVALFWLLVVWAPALICIWVPRNVVRVPIVVLMLVPYAVWIQRLGDQGFFWSLIRPDMATGEGYFDTKAERDLAAAIVACNFYEDPPNCDFPKIDALVRAANVNTVGLRAKTFMDLALDAGAFPRSSDRCCAPARPRATRAARRCTTRASRSSRSWPAPFWPPASIRTSARRTDCPT